MDHSTKERRKESGFKILKSTMLNKKTKQHVYHFKCVCVCVRGFFRLSKTVSAVFRLFENGCVDAHLFDLPVRGAIAFWQLFWLQRDRMIESRPLGEDLISTPTLFPQLWTKRHLAGLCCSLACKNIQKGCN